MGAVALIEILDRDGSVRASHKVDAWPLRVGRALDNDLVLDDPHVAAHHFHVEANDDGARLTVGDTVNGVTVGAHRLLAGERWQIEAVPSTLVAGRTHLRLRLPGHAVAPEVPLAGRPVLAQRGVPLLVLLVLNLLVVGFDTYLATDPEPLGRTLVQDLLSSVGVLVAWCGAWTLLSKLFTRQGHFFWHVRVALLAALAWQLVDGALALVGFAFSWPWLPGHAHVAGLAVAALAFHAHLQAVEPHRPRIGQAFAAAAFVVGLGLSVWSHWQRIERSASELYQASMFPPAFRLSGAVPLDRFLQRVAGLETPLDAKAKKPADEDDTGGSDDEEE